MINMKSMNTTRLNKCSRDKAGGTGGYIGYSFCSKLFLSDTYEGINLYIFHRLFPNLKCIIVHELKAISDQFLENIYLFLKEHSSSNIDYIELHVVKGKKHIDLEMEWTLKWASYDLKFEAIGFYGEIAQFDEIEMFGTSCLLIKKRS